MLALIVVILGHSMEPTIHGPALMHRVATPYAELRVGEVVEYHNDALHTNVAHRIVAGWPGKWVMKGDNNSATDPGYCTPKNYVGEIKP